MSAQPQPQSGHETTCRLCGAHLGRHQRRCEVCGFYQAGGEDRPNPFTRASLWVFVLLFLAVYAASLVVVALAR